MTFWSASLFLRWMPFLTVASIFRLRDYMLREGRNEVTRGDRIVLTLKRPFRAEVTLREYGTDIGTMEEVVVDEVYRHVIDTVRNCSTVVDLGANVGMASLYFAANYAQATIVAIEPHPETFEILRQNVQPLIKLNRIAIEHGAIWSSDRGLSYAEHDSGYSVVAVREQTQGSGASVPGITMPQLMKKHALERIDLLKVDIEGSETELFRGDASWLQSVGAIAIEFHGNSRADSGFDSLMHRYGFTEANRSDHTVLVVRDRQ